MKEKPKTVNTVIRIPAELHEKLRWLAFRERRSQHSIIMEILKDTLQKVRLPREKER